MKYFAARTYIALFYATLFLLPALVFAQSGSDLARSFVRKINEAILYPLITLLLGVAVLVFLYGAFEFVMNADNDGERQRGRSHLLWGVVGILVMVSAMAILEIAAGTFDVDGVLQNARPR